MLRFPLPELRSKYLSLIQTLIACLAFMTVGPSLIVLNKYIMYNLNFPYPIIISNCGMMFSVLFCETGKLLGYVEYPKHKSIMGWNYFKTVMPVGMAQAGTLILGNMVYLHLDMGFIQVNNNNIIKSTLL